MTKTLFFFMFLTAALSAPAQFNHRLHIYLLMGQSNMAGRGAVEGKYVTQGDPRLLMLDKELHWVQARNPVHFDKPSAAGVGPGMSFGLELLRSRKDGDTIALVPCAVGGTSINKWVPGAYDAATKTHPWDDAETRIREAMRHGVIEGVIWHQGESDSNADSAKRYLPKLMDLIARVRTLVGNGRLPFVAGELGRYKDVYQNINSELAKLPAAVANTAVVSSEGLVHKGDQTHFDSPSAETLGTRYAVKMIGLSLKK